MFISGRLIGVAIMSAITLLYLGLSLYQLDLPGLHYDEAFEAVPAVQLLQGQPVTAFRQSGLLVGGRLWPWMTQDYIGALNTYLSIPFIWLLGPTPVALRVMSVGLGLVTLLLTARLAVRLTGPAWVGWVAALLLAVEPTFVFWNRQGVFVTAVTAPLGLAATLCWLNRFERGRWPWSLAGAFLFGLGLYAKVLFVWLIFGLVGAAVLLNLGRLLRSPRQVIAPLSPAELAGAALAFGLGCWPLIAYNLQTGGTWLSITEHSTTSYYGVNNLAFGPNLLERLGQLWTLLAGSHFWYLGRVGSDNLSPALFVGVLVLVVLSSIRIFFGTGGRPGLEKIKAAQSALFPFLVIVLVVLASIGTVSALWITHFAVLMPWPALAVAVGSWFIGHHLQPPNKTRSPLLKLALGLSLAVLSAGHLLATLRYHQALSQSGGLGAHSDAVYDLSTWLDHHSRGPVVAMDWGLAAPVAYLTNGRVTPIEVFGYAWQSDVQLSDRLSGFIQHPDTFYLWRAPDEIIFDRSADFRALYQPQHFEENIEAAFYERSGRPVLGVTRLVPTGTASNPPR